MKQPIDERKVTFLQSNTARLQAAIFLLVFAASFGLWITTALLLLAIGWYANKVFGDD